MVTLRILNTPFDFFPPFGLFCLLFSPWQKSAGTDFSSRCYQYLPNSCQISALQPLSMRGIEKWEYETSDIHFYSFPTIILIYFVSRNVIPGHSDMYKEKEQKVVDQSTNCYSLCSGEQLLKSICR